MPDGDLFKVLADGSAEIVTDTIETFTETGIRLTSGRELEADIVVSATGLKVLPFGGLKFEVDGRPVDLAQTMSYKALMLSGAAQLHLHGRLHQRLVDAQGRPGRRLRLPAARPPGQATA